MAIANPTRTMREPCCGLKAPEQQVADANQNHDHGVIFAECGISNQQLCWAEVPTAIQIKSEEH